MAFIYAILDVLLKSFIFSLIFVFIAIIIIILFCQIRKIDSDGILSKGKRYIIVYIICFSLSVMYVTMKDYWGSDTIGSFFSKYTFDTQYYVQLFPKNSKSKNYLVPAELHIDEDRIYIYKVTWPDGGYSTFDTFGDMDPQEFF